MRQVLAGCLGAGRYWYAASGHLALFHEVGEMERMRAYCGRIWPAMMLEHITQEP